ncbi:MAG: ABC transporter substrate-binding protein [Clostridiales bacterium]|nr:ABC transporter substrate-binding protein [Clostridiales bacterium]
MKKLLALLLASMMLLSMTAVFADVAQDVESAKELTHEELVQKAKAEEGTFIVYGNTSRITTALEDFSKLYDIPGEGNNLKDAEIYTKLEIEIDGSAKGADMVMIQDGASLIYMLNNDYLVNYLPAALAGSVAEDDQNPLVQQYINKLFIYSNIDDKVAPIKNVWALTEPAMKGNVIFKNPETEQVNMNFLVMLTSDDWSDKLADAYKSYFGKDIELGDFKNAGYKWIAEFLSNSVFGSSDTSIAEEISQTTASGKIGLFVLSKLRSSSVLADNLTVAQYDASENNYTVEPFSGFIYPMYALVSSGATRPYTAMLFIEYLMGAEGFAPWGKSIGAYSTNQDLVPLEGDLPISVWKDSLVVENPAYILENYEDVSTFVTKYLQ